MTTTLELERKQSAGRVDPQGTFEAVFATFIDVSGNPAVDADGDVWGVGAIPNGKEVIIGAFGHNSAQLPLGRGKIIVTPTDARVVGQFFLDTSAGLEAYKTMAALGTLGQWSILYSATRSHMTTVNGRSVRSIDDATIYSVDPVLAGAGIGTRTVRIKERPSASAPTMADVTAIKAENERQMIREALEAERKRFQSFEKQWELASMIETRLSAVHPDVRLAAQHAMLRAAKDLSIPTVTVRWFSLARHAREKGLRGFTQFTKPIIWIRDDSSPEQAAWIAAHEMKHRELGPEQRLASGEEECNVYADEQLALARGRVGGLYSF